MRIHLKNEYGIELEVEGERYEVATALEVFGSKFFGPPRGDLTDAQAEALRSGVSVRNCVKNEVKPRKRKSRKR